MKDTTSRTECLRVCTWNVCLGVKYKLRQVEEVVKQNKIDIICLQEVQADYFESQLQPALTRMGYEGVFKQKTRESMGAYGKVNLKP